MTRRFPRVATLGKRQQPSTSALAGPPLTVTAQRIRVVDVGQPREVRRRPPTGVAGGSAWLYRVLVTTRPVDAGALRRGTLAASVLDDIPLTPSADGVSVGRSWDDREAWTPVTWHQLAAAVGDAPPESPAGRLRLRDWLRAYTYLSHLADDATRRDPSTPPSRVVALALPVGHALHPGPDWVVESVLGGVLDVGLGLRPSAQQLAAHPVADRAAVASAGEPLAVPLPAGAARAAEVDTTSWWRRVAGQRDDMAVLAGDRLDRDATGVLRPIGGCDVLTLLSGRWLRDHLATSDGTGMRAVAAPMRSRGWFDLARIDPAFVGAAAAATTPELRGVVRPLLVTTDEVGLAAGQASAEQLAREALRDPARDPAGSRRDVLYR